MLGIAFLLGPMLVIGLIGLIGIRLLGLGVGLFKDMGRIGLANVGVGGVETAAGLRALEAGRLLLETFETGICVGSATARFFSLCFITGLVDDGLACCRSNTCQIVSLIKRHNANCSCALAISSIRILLSPFIIFSQSMNKDSG
ncbi:unannotated protein [freshwater metagenome]|jgi:hypothetical protein|uniref:Unannotated protein n=1 Tax=freshwater metagenome TaxID=449393 RepID=A0A6J6ZVI5_9ZZZZ|nr:hypothetical protein [Actinomycetota bacterium]